MRFRGSNEAQLCASGSGGDGPRARCNGRNDLASAAACWRRRPATAAGLRSSRPSIEAFRLVDASEDRFSKRMNFRNGEQVLQLELVGGIGPGVGADLIEDGIMGVHALHAQALGAYTPRAFRNKCRPPSASDRSSFARPSTEFLTVFSFVCQRAVGLWRRGRRVDQPEVLLGLRIYCDTQRTVYKIRIFAPLAHSATSLESYFLSLPCS